MLTLFLLVLLLLLLLLLLVLLPQVLLVLPLGEVLIHSLMLMYSIIAVVLRYISTVRSAHNGDCLLKIDGLLVNGQPSYSIQHIIYNITNMYYQVLQYYLF